MDAWLVDFSNLDRIFLLTGVIGALVVVVRMLMLFLGGGLDGDDFGGGDGDGSPDPGDGFEILSLHGLSSFFMMFGLVGLALSWQTRAGMGLSLLGGVLAGLGSLWVIARLFKAALGLQASGNVDPQSAVGCVGTVYLRIPAGGTGRVTVRIGARLREMDATAAAEAALSTGTAVRVVRVDQSVLVVEPLTSEEA